MQVIHHLVHVGENLGEHDRIHESDRAESRELGLWNGCDTMASSRAGAVIQLDGILQVVAQERLLFLVDEGVVAGVRVVALGAGVMARVVDGHGRRRAVDDVVEAADKESRGSGTATEFIIKEDTVPRPAGEKESLHLPDRFMFYVEKSSDGLASYYRSTNS